MKSLHAKIGEPTLENDFLEGALSKAGCGAQGDDRRAHHLPITKQRKTLNINRGSVYYPPRPVSEADLAAMRHPTASGVPLRRKPNVERPAGGRGRKIGRRLVKTLMRRMGIGALYRRSRTTKPRGALAQRQIRGGVSTGLRKRRRRPRFDWPLPGLLQWPTSTFEP